MLTTHYDPCDPLVWGDAELLKQVVLNLVWNAIHAMPHGGNLVIATEIVGDALVKYAVGDRSSPLSAKGIEGKGYVEIRFTDSGTGISKENKKQIFNPFFTTKEKGTGLGLAIVHKIIEAHRGMIEVESSIGQGSTFTITLPLVGKGTR
jgi:signal transduction histidine kinase